MTSEDHEGQNLFAVIARSLRVALQTQDTPSAFDEILTELMVASGSAFAMLFVAGAGREEGILRLRHIVGRAQTLALGEAVSTLGIETFYGFTSSDHRPQRLERLGEHGYFRTHPLVTSVGASALGMAPVYRDGKLAALVYVGSVQGGPDLPPDLSDLLTVFAAIVQTVLEREAQRGALARSIVDVSELKQQSRQNSEDIQRMLQSMVRLLLQRDPETAEHDIRAGLVADAIGRELQLSPQQLRQLRYGAYLHDLGKLALPQRILRKEGTLSPAEQRLLRRHPTLGWAIVQDVPGLAGAADIVLYHHERFDGSGYPRGLKGVDIPLLARVFAVAECFDAMTGPCAYRPSLDAQAAAKEIARGSGSQFDPYVVAAFLACRGEVERRLREAQAAPSLDDIVPAPSLRLLKDASPAGVLKMATSLLQPRALDALADQVLTDVQTLFGYPFCSIWIWDEQLADLRVLAFRGASTDGLPRPIWQNGIVGHAFRSREIYMSPDVASDPYYMTGRHQAVVGSEVAFPLLIDGRAIGVLDVESPSKHDFPPHVNAMLEAFALVVALAMQNVQREQELRTLASTDGLTGLANRRAFWQALQAATADPRCRPLALLVLEVDGFKRVNDRFGHLAGDAALRIIASEIRRTVADLGVAARIGGDEFSALLYRASPLHVTEMAERIRSSVLHLHPAKTQPVTLSIGAAVTTLHDGCDVDTFFEAADMAMYEAKRAGGNRALVYVDGVPLAEPEGGAEAALT